MSEAGIPDVEWHSVKVFTDGVVCTGFRVERGQALYYACRGILDAARGT